MKKNFYVLTMIGLGFSSCTSNPPPTDATALSKDSVVAIARAAFVYAMPLALMDMTRKKVTNTIKPTSGTDLAAPVNQLAIATQFPNAKFTAVVRPNADTYYHTGFLDLSSDALVLTVPNTNGRYYLLPMLDAFGNVFASPGKRTTGTLADTFLITGPKWTGNLPDGMKRIKAPGDMVWLLGRIQVNSEADGAKVVVPIEKKINITPLSSWGKAYTAPDGKIDSLLPKEGPNAQLEAMPVDVFFNYVNTIMVNNPPAAADSTVLSKFAKIGVGPGLKFDISSFDTATQAELKAIPKALIAYLNEILASGKVNKPVNNWNVLYKGMGSYGTDYDLRAIVCYAGLGANLPEDAVYPQTQTDSAGNPYDGANKYVLRFAKGQTPPVHGFWSLTMYNEAGYFIENPINRYAIGNRNPLKFNADSSVDLYIQNLSPGKDKENNWLPAPKGKFNLTMRMYWPAAEFLDGNWTPPAVVKVN
jgi:DNA sulfur modification protein DndE